MLGIEPPIIGKYLLSKRTALVEDKIGNIFLNNTLTTEKEVMQNAIKEIFVDMEFKEGISMASFQRNYNGTWSIKLYDVSQKPYNLICSFSAETYNENGTYQLVKLTGQCNAYIVIDWSKIEEGVLYSSLVDSIYYLSHQCFSLDANPTIKSSILELSNITTDYIKSMVYDIASSNNHFIFDKIDVKDFSFHSMQLMSNFNIPQKGACISTDINYRKRRSEDDVEENIKSFVPCMYYNGQKVGMMLLIDDNGAYYIDNNGAKKYVQINS